MNFTFLKKISTPSQCINQETDSQMLIRIGKKFALLFFVILISDTLIDLFLGLIDLMLEGLHLVIEIIEYSIEVLLEYAINADHQQSEIIIVNSASIIALYLVYRFYLVAPKVCDNLKSKYLLCLDNNCSHWQAIPLIRKIKLSSAYCLGIFCILFILPL